MVLIPETMAVLETERLLAELDAYDIHAGRAMINKVIEDPTPAYDLVSPAPRARASASRRPASASSCPSRSSPNYTARSTAWKPSRRLPTGCSRRANACTAGRNYVKQSRPEDGVPGGIHPNIDEESRKNYSRQY